MGGLVVNSAVAQYARTGVGMSVALDLAADAIDDISTSLASFRIR
jgi:hypothetical protein